MTTENKDICWKQRFQHYEKAYKLLERTLKIENLSEAERGGLIQFYEMTFELAWKLMKDYLENEGYNIRSPRDTIKQALQAEVIENGYVWIDALEDRNLTLHTYDEEIANEVAGKIKNQYFPILREFFNFIKKT